MNKGPRYGDPGMFGLTVPGGVAPSYGVYA